MARVRSALLYKDGFTFVSPGSPTAEKRGDDDITDDDDEKNEDSRTNGDEEDPVLLGKSSGEHSGYAR